ncbi:MAG: hypothetical protein ACKVWR_17790 [Acidimicrobiales bacterium]
MKIQKLKSTDGFISWDLDGAERAVGIVRSAPKILQGGAEMLARSVTYSFAAFGLPISGASVGVNAKPEDRPGALASFVDEVLPMVETGQLTLDPGRGVDEAALSTLRQKEHRAVPLHTVRAGVSLADHLVAIGAAAAAGVAVDGLADKTVAIEGFGPVGVALARRVGELGGRVVAISTGAGSAIGAPLGFAPADLAAAWEAHGERAISQLLADEKPAWAVFGVNCDVLFVGSKAGALTHEGAEHVKAKAVVPIGPTPVTPRAMAMLSRAGSVYLPDFLTIAGPLLAGEAPPGSTEEWVVDGVQSSIVDAVVDAARHPEGPFLGACQRAEDFLRTWRDALPFGRPTG